MAETIFSSLADRADARVGDSGMRPLFTTRARWQAWLDVEAALALTEAALGMFPDEAGRAIAAACLVDRLDHARLEADFARTRHPFMPLVLELSRAVGEPHAAWVHWGATTQNMMQTGDVLNVRRAHRIVLRQLAGIMKALADLAERSADMVMAGRTHGQHAVPITFGLKVAGWIDELGRHIARLRELEPRLFVAMVGGAVGNFASFGDRGPAVQDGVAKRLRLAPMAVPLRTITDPSAELVCVLGLLAASCGKIAHEILNLMKTEYGEVEEPIGPGDVGSSTMPQKRNPKLCMDVLGMTAEIRSVVPMAVEAIQGEHEADQASNVAYETMRRSLILTGEVLEHMKVLVADLRLDPRRMRRNLELSGGTISAEAIMLKLGETLGRQPAHEVVHEAARAAVTRGGSFPEILAADPRVARHVDRPALDALIDPAGHTGLSARIALEQAKTARRLAQDVDVHLASPAGQDAARPVGQVA